MNKLILPLLLAISACATTPPSRPEPQIVTVEVPVPVAQPCVPETLASPPTYPDTDAALAAASGPVRLQLLWAGRVLRMARLGEVEPVVAACPRGHSVR